MFGKDPKDAIIEILREELRVAHEENAELRRALVGFHDARVLAMTTLARRQPQAPGIVPMTTEGEKPRVAAVDFTNPLAHLRTRTIPSDNLNTSKMTPEALEASFRMPADEQK